MLTYRTTYRVIYGDTDNMGVAYYANYLRWFEIGRTEMFRDLGLTYREVEQKGIFLPVSEAHCKYLAPAHYDDVLVIETTLDTTFRAGMKMDYRVLRKADGSLLAEGFTRHAYLNRDGKVVRPPRFLTEMVNKRLAG